MIDDVKFDKIELPFDLRWFKHLPPPILTLLPQNGPLQSL